MNLDEGSKRITRVGIATAVTGVLSVVLAIVLDVRPMMPIRGYLFILGVFMAGGGFVLGVIGYIVQGFAKSN